MSSERTPAEGEVCPTCRELYDVLMRKGVAEAVAAAVDNAHMHGPGCGVLFTDLARMPAAGSLETWDVDAAHECGFYLGDCSLDKLKELARANQAHEDSAHVAKYFDFLLRGREVAVLFVWKGHIALLWAKASPRPGWDDDDDRHEYERSPVLTEYFLRETLLCPKKPMVQLSTDVLPAEAEVCPKVGPAPSQAAALGRPLQSPKLPTGVKSHQPGPAHVASTNPVVETSRKHDPVKVGSAPSQAAKPADTTPAVSRPPSKREARALDPRLVRMVLRVAPELQEDLITISERLFDETRLEYSYAAIVRGLISLGLAAIAGKAALAVEFAGARVPRGRKPGAARKPREREEE